MMQVLKSLLNKLKITRVQTGVILPSLDNLLMITFLEILETKNLKLLNENATQKQLEEHWKKIYDDFWSLKNDSFSKMILRQEDEICVKEARLSILYTIFNALVSLSNLPTTDKTIEQKTKLIQLYEKQTKNSIKVLTPIPELLEKIKASIKNLENQVKKQIESIRSKQVKEVKNKFDAIAIVVATLQVPLDIKKISVSEYLSYEKLAKQKQQSYEK